VVHVLTRDDTFRDNAMRDRVEPRFREKLNESFFMRKCFQCLAGLEFAYLIPASG